MVAQALEHFHPLVRRWFEERFVAPTDAQAKAWPIIATGEHVLVSAPTGSGKTLTAFLSAIDNLVTGRWSCGAIRALYLSPLKALNSDVRLNLLAPLGELRALFEREGCPFPPIRVATRSGDTPDDERRAMLRHPPEILITTPESLNLMLIGTQSRQLFGGLQTVILDEIHALAGSKRGTYMMSAVERITMSAAKFQRIALSATVRPAETVAAWMAGFEVTNPGPDASYRPRPVKVVHAADRRDIALSVRTPDVERVKGPDAADLWWDALAAELKKIIAKNRSTLVFANSRRTVEKIARLLNVGESEPIAYSHHGSLSREIRLDVEERMKQGRLRAVVATGSLELGIDIGAVEEVILVGTPPSVAQSVQRIGRADHRVGGTSKASLFTLHGLDGAQAASMVGLVQQGEVEEIRPIRNALDVLAQVLLSMGCHAVWNLDELFAFVRTMAAYHELPRRHFDLVIAMLAGRYADAPIRELRARALVDRANNTFTARSGTEFVLYQSGGTIPDRGYYHLRLADSKAVIGELDEEFVWERRLGDQFSLGTQAWRILNVTQSDVEVGPADPHGPMIPFWKADEQNRSTRASFALLDFFDVCEAGIDREDFAQTLDRGMDAISTRSLVDFLLRQRRLSGAPLPGRQRVLVECTKDPAQPGEMQQVVLHTFWGGKVNRPLALAMAEAWERVRAAPLDTFATNDHILVMLPDASDPATLFDLVPANALDELLRARLEKTALFGSRFRENASRALLLPRGDAKKRYPLWLNRLRSKKLLASVLRFEDFPILLETWRDLLEDEFEIPTLAGLLDDIAQKRIALHVARPAHPTPFSDGIVFRQTNYHMYLDDAPGSAGRSNLTEELFRDLFSDASPTPTVPEALAAEMASKLLRTHPGYEPATPEEILLAVRENPLAPAKAVASFIERLSPNVNPDRDALAGLVAYVLPGATQELACDLADLPRILGLRGVAHDQLVSLRSLLGGAHGPITAYLEANPFRSQSESAATLVGDFLRCRTAVSLGEISAALGFAEAELLPLLAELIESENIVAGQLLQDRQERLFCDKENAERLLRLHRTARRASAEQSLRPRPLAELPHFLAEWHGLGRPTGGLDALQSAFDRLFGFPLPAELWEQAILPSRLAPYYPSWLDTLFQSYGLSWFGCGKAKVAFALTSDLDLFIASAKRRHDDSRPEAIVTRHLENAGSGIGFFDLATVTTMNTSALAEALWGLAWQGDVATDSYETVRRGILSDFAALEANPTGAAGRSGFRRWERTRPGAGAWHLLQSKPDRSPLENAELEKERARLVLARHGVVFRELLEHELAPLRWPRLFRALRLLELSGEIVSGHFFLGVPGIQFATHEALRRLGDSLPSEAVYFVNACDPASLCGLGLGGLPEQLPRRIPGNWMVFRGSQLLLVVQKNGRELTVLVEPGDASLEPALAIYRFFLGREFSPLAAVTLETVNGVAANASPYADALRTIGFANDYRGMNLWKR